jgi:hypothetical protein
LPLLVMREHAALAGVSHELLGLRERGALVRGPARAAVAFAVDVPAGVGL